MGCKSANLASLSHRMFYIRNLYSHNLSAQPNIGIQQVGDKATALTRRRVDQTDTMHGKNSSGKYLGKEFPKHHCFAAWDFLDKQTTWLLASRLGYMLIKKKNYFQAQE